MREYLIEGVTGAFPFIVDRTKPIVTESRPSGGSIARIPGRFSVCDCINGNKRRYRRAVWEKNLQPGSSLMESIARNAAFGLLEHPKDGIITLQSPISHHVTKAELVEGQDEKGNKVYEVIGEISLYNPQLIPESGKLLGLIEGGYNPLVSSRGYGTLVRASDGVDDVDVDYVCEGWDVVIKPSFDRAELQPMREPPVSTTTAHLAVPAKPDSTAESKAVKAETSLTENKEIKNLKESPSTGAATAVVSNKPQIKAMELNEIKGRISTLRSLDPSKLDPQRFAESLATVEELHKEVAVYGAADATRSYEAHRLQTELDKIAQTIGEAAQAPRRQAAKLTENNTKLMRVINAVAQTAMTFKKRLGESMKAQSKSQEVLEELTRRGQGWRDIAEDRKGKLSVRNKQFDNACEALDIMAKRYHEDTTELARRVIQLEFKEKVDGSPEVAKRLKEATRLRHIAAIREELEGKKPAATPKEGAAPGKEGIKDKKQKGAPSPEEGKVAGEPGKVTNEDKSKDSPKPPLTEAKVSFSEPRDPRGLNESVEMVRRLSGATAK